MLLSFLNTEPINITMEGQHVIQTSFEPTEIMSTYLLAFVVCEFGFISTPPGAEVLVIFYYILQSELHKQVYNYIIYSFLVYFLNISLRQ